MENTLSELSQAVASCKVSIGITTFNRIDMLIEAIQSVANQTYANVEVIIGNDNPNRNLSLANLGLPEDKRIKIINRSENLGEIRNLNSLLNEASGEFFTWLADDDVLHPQHIEILLKPLLDNSSVKAAFSGYTSDLVEFTTNIEMTINPPFFSEYQFGKFISEYSQRSMKIIGCYGLFDRPSLVESNGFLHLGRGFSPYSDTLIPLSVSKLGSVAVTESQTIYFRSHSESMSNSLSDLDSYLSAEIDFINSVSDLVRSESTASQMTIYKAFYPWFRENHLTVISRSPESLLLDLFAWIKSSVSNFKNFSRFGLYKAPGFTSGLVELSKHRISQKIRR